MNQARRLGLCSVVMGLLFCVPVRSFGDAAVAFHPSSRESRNLSLIKACKSGKLMTVRSLLTRGADPTWSVPGDVEYDGEPGPAAITAAEWGEVEVVRLLLDVKPELVTRIGYQMLIRAIGNMDKKDNAATSGQAQVAKLLIERKVPPGYDGKASVEWPLYVAIRKGNIAAVNLLLDAGVSVNDKGSAGEMPLYTAACGDQIAIVEVLLKRGADLSSSTKWNQIPLRGAASCGKPKMVTFLLEKKANPNQADDFFGETPLMVAAEAGNLEIVKLLLAAKSNVKLQNKKGETALSLAKGQKPQRPDHPAIIKLLEDAMK